MESLAQVKYSRGWVLKVDSEIKEHVIEPGTVGIMPFAFCGCQKLRKITMPDSLKYIGGKSFEMCHVLYKVNFSANLAVIGASAFSQCTLLENITLPQSLKVIEPEAFFGCEKLKHIFLPENVKMVGANAFGGCSNLEDFTVDDKNRHLKVISGDLYTYDGKRLVCCPTVTLRKSVKIAEGTEVIGESAFARGNMIKRITIPSGVKKIERYAFGKCEALGSVALPYGVEELGEKAFYGCTSMRHITIPNSLITLGKNALDGCPLEKITYSGTKNQWYLLSEQMPQDDNRPIRIFCTDGIIYPKPPKHREVQRLVFTY